MIRNAGDFAFALILAIALGATLLRCGTGRTVDDVDAAPEAAATHDAGCVPRNIAPGCVGSEP